MGEKELSYLQHPVQKQYGLPNSYVVRAWSVTSYHITTQQSSTTFNPLTHFSNNICICLTLLENQFWLFRVINEWKVHNILPYQLWWLPQAPSHYVPLLSSSTDPVLYPKNLHGHTTLPGWLSRKSPYTSPWQDPPLLDILHLSKTGSTSPRHLPPLPDLTPLPDKIHLS